MEDQFSSTSHRFHSTDKVTNQYDAPVLIIGGGPAGLFQSYLLARLGIGNIVIERYPDRLGAPKAHALSPRSLEICRQFSLDVSQIRQLGTRRADAFWVNFLTTLNGEVVGRLPYERMDIDVLNATPEMIHNIPQPTFEQFLADNLASCSKVVIRKGHTFLSLVQDASGVTTTIQERVTSRKYQLRSRYLIACDGAKSSVRTFLGVGSDGEDSYETMMTIHINANLRPIIKDRVGMLHWMLDPMTSGFIIGYDLSGNEVLISNFDPEKHPIQTWNESLCRKVVTSAVGESTDFDILSYRPWVLSRKVATSYRSQNVFLAGDAAHSFPPTGGLGLNCGLGDVHNLAWKIAKVVMGEASQGLLDTYEADRRPVAVVYALQSVKNGRSIFKLLKTLGIRNDMSVEDTRHELSQRIQDPAKKAAIDSGIEEQREHFDNLGLHIGYVYGSQLIPDNASHYAPKFEPGARLPHAWIKFTSFVTLPPVDLSYVEEFTPADRARRQHSTLDLCLPRAFTLIIAESTFDNNIHGLEVRRLGHDFDLSFPENDWINGSGLTDGNALLIRPDQHILCVYRQIPKQAQIKAEIDNYLGLAAEGNAL